MMLKLGELNIWTPTTPEVQEKLLDGGRVVPGSL